MSRLQTLLSSHEPDYSEARQLSDPELVELRKLAEQEGDLFQRRVAISLLSRSGRCGQFLETLLTAARAGGPKMKLTVANEIAELLGGEAADGDELLATRERAHQIRDLLHLVEDPSDALMVELVEESRQHLAERLRTRRAQIAGEDCGVTALAEGEPEPTPVSQYGR